MTGHVLDDPARASLLGAHAHLAERRGRALRHPLAVAPFPPRTVELGIRSGGAVLEVPIMGAA